MDFSASLSDDQELSPLVTAVSLRLRALIQSEKLDSGKGLPSERRLASEFEVSRAIVRAAIRKLASEGLLEVKSNCRPVVRTSPIQSSAKRNQLNIWLWPDTSDFSAASILKGIQMADLGDEIKLVVGTATQGNWDSVYDAEQRFFESLANNPQESCAIVWHLGGERSLPVLQKLRGLGVPLVFVDRLPPKGFTADFVGTNNEHGADVAVSHLLSLGHRRVAMITNIDKASCVFERENGYRKALIKAGIPITSNLIQRDRVDEPIGICEALDNLFSLPEPPTAIFCINDHIALQVYEELEARGLKIPGDISLVGFDGLLRWVPKGGYLTTVCQDFQLIGRTAAELALARMSPTPPDVYRHYFFDAGLFDGGSTGACRDRGSAVR